MRAPFQLMFVAVLIAASSPSGARAQSARALLGPRERPTVEFRRDTAPVETSAFRRGTAARDTVVAPIGNRRLHAVIGAGIGFAAGFIVGKSVDGGRAGCNREGSGQNCDWLSGYEEIIGGLAGAAIGAVIGAVLPHD